MQKTTTLAIITILSILCGAAACSSAPVTGRRQVDIVPDEQIEKMGDQAWAELRAKTPQTKDQSIKDFVTEIARQVVSASSYSKQKWDVAVFESKQVNAFALPGGHIGIYTGILPVAQNAAALAAVIGHEIGHVVARHHDERVSQQLIAQGVLSGASVAIGGKYHDVLMGALGVGAQVGFLLPYSRKQETEADVIGLQFMAAAGYDPREAVALWKRMAAAGGGQEPPPFMSSHPPSGERIRKLEELMPQALEIYARAPRQQGQGSRAPATR